MMNNDIIRIDEIANPMIKRWKMILLVTLVTTLLALIISYFIIPPKYEANTKVFIGKENTTGQDQNYSTNDVQMYQKLIKTYAEIIKTNDLVQRAIDSSDINLNSENVLDNLSVTPRTDTQILEISYVSANQALAGDVVNSVTNEFIRSSREFIPNGNVKVVESVKVPQKPVSPNKKMYIGVGLLLGLIGSVGASFLLEFFNNTFKTREEVEEILGLPVLGVIPDLFKEGK